MSRRPEAKGKDRRKDRVTDKTGEGQDARKNDTVKQRATGSRKLGQTANESNREAEHKRKQKD